MRDLELIREQLTRATASGGDVTIEFMDGTVVRASIGMVAEQVFYYRIGRLPAASAHLADVREIRPT